MFSPLPPHDPARFQEAVDAFRKRVPVSDAAWRAMTDAARSKAFKVAGVAQLSVVADVAKAARKAVEDGETLADFKKRVGKKLRAEWAGTVSNPSARIETIFRTNVQTAYSEGTWHQLQSEGTRRVRPYIKSTPILDVRTERICEAIKTVILPSDHPWWLTHWAPLHFQCRRSQVGLTEKQALKQGVTKVPPAVSAAPGFGNAPGHGTGWEPDLSEVPPELRDAKRIGLPEEAAPEVVPAPVAGTPAPTVTPPPDELPEPPTPSDDPTPEGLPAFVLPPEGEVIERKGWSRKKTYLVPLAELDDIPAIIWNPNRAADARKAFAEGKTPPPIEVLEWEGLRELKDGNHRLAVARELGLKTLPVRFLDKKAAQIRRRQRGTNPLEGLPKFAPKK